MGTPTDVAAATWAPQARTALTAASQAGRSIRAEFGIRDISQRKGPFDIQLRADLTSQQIIMAVLSRDFPDYGVVAEENLGADWNSADLLWTVDPLDGTNNFGYGVAHCAIAVSLFHRELPVLAVVHDPLLGRDFCARVGVPAASAEWTPVALPDATISLISNYTSSARMTIGAVEAHLGRNCKRVLRLWAPALDLGLVATGTIDAALCLNAKLLDVCAGMFLLQQAGATILDLNGTPLTAQRSMWPEPVSFVAARDPRLAADLLNLVTSR